MTVYDYCTGCGTPISENEPYWSVQYSHESFDGSNIKEAMAVAQFCEQCARSRDVDTIQIPTKSTHKR